MTIFQGSGRKKPSGGKLRQSRSKRRYELGREPTMTRIGNESRKVQRGHGGNTKAILMLGSEANVYDPKSKKTTKTKVVTVKANPANPHFVQRNILNKGTVISTEAGDARITSRPGQDGVINAVLL